MKLQHILSASCLSLFALGASAQVSFEPEAGDYTGVGVYDFWEESPFRTGQLTGNCAVVKNPFLDEVNPSDYVLGCQRSLYGSNLYGARVDLAPDQRFELTPEMKYVHVMLNKPVEGRCLIIALGKHSNDEWAHQHTDVVQATALAINSATTDKWSDVIFPIQGAGNIDIYSLVFVFDCESTHRLKSPFVAYMDDIVVNKSDVPRIALVGDYPLSFVENQKSTQGTSRRLVSVKTNIAGTTTTTKTSATTTNVTLYTNNITTRLAAKPGDSFTTTFNYSAGSSGLNGYVYLDRDNNGKFSTALEADGKPAEGSDVMTYSLFNGLNSNGESVASQNTMNPPAFTVPADLKKGLYRMRFKVDRNCLEPSGSTDADYSIIQTAGHIMDVLLNVHEDEITVLNAQRNGEVVVADGTTFSGGYKHAFMTPLRVKSVPEKGFRNGGIYVRHGYNLNGDSLVHSNPQFVTEFYPASKFDENNEIEIPADVLDGDVLIEGVMVEDKDTPDPEPSDEPQASIPVAIQSGWNADCIYNGFEAGPTARGPLDTHGSQLIQPYDGMPTGYTVLPEDLAFTTSAGHKYQLADGAGDNCLVLTKDTQYWTNHKTATSGTLVFANPVKAEQLGFAVVGANKENYALAYKATLNYADGTHSEAFPLETPDWGHVSTPAYGVSARWRYTYTNGPANNEHFEAGNYSLSEQMVDVDQEKAIESVTFDYDIATEDAWGWGYITIFGVSALEAVEIPVGIIAPEMQNSNDAIYNLQGRRVQNSMLPQGIYIEAGRKVLH